jgi:hypothetical protein
LREALHRASLIIFICAGVTMGTKQGESDMINFKLSTKSESLKPYLRDLLIYSGISNVVVEVGPERTREDALFIQEEEFDNLEDILVKFALEIYNANVHKKCLSSSVVSLSGKYGSRSAEKIASVIEKAIEPTSFFVMERVPLNASHQNG